ncbi:hypothetical protein EMCRGX_G026036 [Ephydatia muelleri]
MEESCVVVQNEDSSHTRNPEGKRSLLSKTEQKNTKKARVGSPDKVVPQTLRRSQRLQLKGTGSPLCPQKTEQLAEPSPQCDTSAIAESLNTVRRSSRLRETTEIAIASCGTKEKPEPLTIPSEGNRSNHTINSPNRVKVSLKLPSRKSLPSQISASTSELSDSSEEEIKDSVSRVFQKRQKALHSTSGRDKSTRKASEEPVDPQQETKPKGKRRRTVGNDTGSASKGKVVKAVVDTTHHPPLDKERLERSLRNSTAKKGKGRTKGASVNSRASEIVNDISVPFIDDFIQIGMASQSNKDNSGNEPQPQGNGSEDQGPSYSGGASVGGPGGDGRAADPFAMMSEETRRLQSLLEARGLPPHLLGALGSKMHWILHKSASSSNSSKAAQLLAGIEQMQDESLQLQSCIELGQLLVMGNEDTLSGFPVKQAVPALINLLSMEHNFDMLVNACRAMTYMMEALPRSAVVVADAIPLLIEKLQVIQCMDVAEQALTTLEMLSRKHSKAILQAGGLNACLLYLDFFSIGTQRCALSVAANCCQFVTEEDFSLVADAIPVLSSRLSTQDKRSVESCCTCFSRLTDNFSTNPKILHQVASHGLLSNLQQLLIVSPPVISSSVFVTALKMLSTLCASCPLLAVDLLKLNIADTLRYLLLGSGEITLENLELVSRSPNEIYEILSLTSELLPPLPKDGIFQIDEIMSTKRLSMIPVQWQWQESDGTWRDYGTFENRLFEAGYAAREEEVNFVVMGNIYVLDLATMQQINEDTGTTRPVRRQIISADKGSKQLPDPKADPRAILLVAEPQLCISFIKALFGALYEVFNSMAGSSVRHKCLRAMLRMLYYTEADVLKEILKDLTVSSHLAMLLQSQDYKIAVGAVQMANVLIQKLPDTFLIYFHREGVMHHMKALRDVPLKMLATPKEEMGPPFAPLVPPPAASPSVVPPAAAEASPQTPTSTRKKLSDIFRKGRRQFRKSLSRGRSEEEGPKTQPLPTPVEVPVISIPTRVEPKMTVAGSPGDEALCSGTTKEQVQEWIQRQATAFVQQWCSQQYVVQEAMRKLEESSKQLEVTSPSGSAALHTLCSVLVQPESCLSAFEFLHCRFHIKLMSYLTADDAQCYAPLNARLRQFVQLFMDLPDQASSLINWVPGQQAGMVALLQKLHGCVNLLEQFSVKVHDLPERRGSQALKFLSSHQIKCNLERHPSAVNVSQWKGGPVRIDPLATVQAVERYMVIRGYGKQDQASRKREDWDTSEDSEVDDSVLLSLQALAGDKHHLEFLIGDQVLPYSMTVFQAIRQFALGGASETEDEITPLGRPDIWVKAHTLYYRLTTDERGSGESSVATSSKSSSTLTATSVAGEQPSTSRRLAWGGSGGSLKKRSGPAKAASFSGSNVGSVKMTRSSSKEKVPSGEAVKEKDKVYISPLHRALKECASMEFKDAEDPSLPVIRLMNVLFQLNCHWADLYEGVAGNPLAAQNEFVNNKLTAKAVRQLQDPFNVMTGSVPQWLKTLVKTCPFLFPFECRQTLFYLSTFDRDRAISRLQKQQPDLAADDSSQTVSPRLDKKKRVVQRESLLEQADKILSDLAGGKALLEVSFEDEVGTGLGPTLEFYALVSKDFQRADLQMWRGEHCPPLPSTQGFSGGGPQYVHSTVGLFPAPLGSSTEFRVVEEVCNRFRTLGKLIAKSLMDSRILDISLSEAFYKWMLHMEDTFTAQDLQHVDTVVARSFAQLAAVAVKKHALESDPLLSGKALAIGIESLALEGGGSVEDLDLDFTLPGYPDIELKVGGKEIAVTVHNLDEYLKLVVDWTMVRGVARQMEAFREGFNTIFPINNLRGFYPSEMDALLCGANNQKWDNKELMEYSRPNHGYSHDSRAVQFLFDVLSTYNSTEQRQFIEFVTGSPRLPVGGFKALNPPLTIVCKSVDPPQNPDHFPTFSNDLCKLSQAA